MVCVVRNNLKTRTFSVRTTMQDVEGPEENELCFERETTLLCTSVYMCLKGCTTSKTHYTPTLVMTRSQELADIEHAVTGTASHGAACHERGRGRCAKGCRWVLFAHRI